MVVGSVFSPQEHRLIVGSLDWAGSVSCSLASGLLIQACIAWDSKHAITHNNRLFIPEHGDWSSAIGHLKVI